MGRTVAVADDTIVAAGGQRAYVFTRAGTWATGTEARRLTVTGSSNAFPTAVATDGNSIVLGDSDANGTVSYQGLAYIYTRPAGGWTSAPTRVTVRASNPKDGDRFGHNVAVAGGTAVVAALHAGDDYGGALYVFTKSLTGWVTGTEQARLTATDPEPQYNSQVGVSLAIGDTAIVTGTYRSAYVFQKPTTGDYVTATETAKVLPWDPGTIPGGSFFGAAVAIAGDTFVISAPWEWDGYGAAYIGSVVPDRSLYEVSELVSSRASQTSVDAVAASLGTRASQASVDTLSQSVAGLSGMIVGRASQASVDALGLSLAGVGAAIASRSSQASVDSLASQMSLVNGTVESRASQSSVDLLAGSLGHLDVPMSSRASQATVDAILAKVGSCSGGGPPDDKVELRRDIERALAYGQRVVSFFLPTDRGGHLDLVREVVDDSITNANAVGIPITKALRELAFGDFLAGVKGDYKEAYDAYARAYAALLK